MKSIHVLILSIVSLSPVFAQEAETESVTYDPTFWAQELRLDNQQLHKIEAINAEFYQLLKERPTLTQLHDYLQTRQELILETFHNRQKRKWEKIVSSL
ncbi:MAG: hypothetical protein J0L66_17790 [Cytophagales bacterium]|nr:hypothetical protein [Cytophagales bacterium]